METVLSSKPAHFLEVERIRIADINFGLTNAAQIDVLRKRGLIARKLDVQNQRIAKFTALRGKLEDAEFEKRVGKMLKSVRILDVRTICLHSGSSLLLLSTSD